MTNKKMRFARQKRIILALKPCKKMRNENGRLKTIMIKTMEKMRWREEEKELNINKTCKKI